jgi:hypothetical protein
VTRAAVRRLTALAALVAALGTVAVAWAYFLASGRGTANARTGMLAAPGTPAATAGAGTVALTWPAITPPASGSVTYYVSRDGGTPAGTCPTQAAPTGATSCTDTGLSAGSHTYTVTALWRSWTARSVTRSVTLTSGAAAKIVLSGSSANLASGTSRTFTATIEDAAGNTVTTGPDSTDSITFGRTAGTGSVTGLTTVAASAGVAGDAVTGNVAGSVTLTASGTVNGSAISSNAAAFTVTPGTASRLAFTQQPSSSSAGAAFATQPIVSVQDAAGNTVTSDSSTVTLAITSGTPASGGPGTLSGCSQTETAGVITFTGCSIGTTGTGYKLHATDGSLTAADSGAFNIAAGAATKLVFTQQPSGSTGGIALTTQPKVTVQDALGNVVTGDSSTVTLAITSGTPASGGPGTLSGCSQTETAGVITFSGCAVNTAGTGYKLHATDGSLTAADSAAFNIGVGPAAQLAFTQQPSNSTGGTPFATQPKVAVQDAGGNVITGDASTVTLAIASGTPASGGPGTVSGCTQTEAAGVITFSGCGVNTPGTGYKLHATDGSLTAADSATFTITAGPATKFVLAAATTSPTAGASDNLTITAEDAAGNTATSYTGAHSLTFGGAGTAPSGTHPTVTNSAGTAVNFGTATSITFAAGVATVSGSSNGAMTLYTAETAHITVSDGSISNGSGLTVTVGAGASSQIVASAGAAQTAGVAFSVALTAEDAYGNQTALTGTKSVSFSGPASAPNGTAPSYPATVSFSAGAATAPVKLYDAQTTTITAADTTDGVAGTTSGTITVAAGAPSNLWWTALSVGANGTLSACNPFACSWTGAGKNHTITGEVEVTDASGNVVSGLGSGHTVGVSGAAGSGGTLTIAATGPAVSTTGFSYATQTGNNWTSDTLTAATAGGTTYASAALSISK